MQSRCIYTTTRLHASQIQVGRIMNKVMNSDKKKKNHHKPLSETVAIPSNNIPSFQSKCKKKRVSVLNKIFMKYITDLMATGEVAPKLLGKGLEISHVEVSSNYKLITVYWFAEHNTDADGNIEKLLKMCAGHLQHELSQLRIIGMVPPINFIKNKYYSVIKEVEDKLSKVDFGEDVSPTAYIENSKTQTSKNNKYLGINNENNEKEETYEISVPEMKHNVLGFDHSIIMKKIKLSLGKIKDAKSNRIVNISEDSVDLSRQNEIISTKINEFLSNKEEKQLFDEFLKKRSIDQKRKQRAISLKEFKNDQETLWHENVNDSNNESDTPVADEYRNEYADVESYK